MERDSKNTHIAQITWITYLNFGTFLQAFALQRIIQKLGYNTYIIDDRSIVNKPLKSIKEFVRYSLSLGKLFYTNVRGKKSRKYFYKIFSIKHLAIDSNWKSFDNLNQEYDFFICGSDQIWSPALPSQNDGFYYASFSTEPQKKIAYGPSLGLNSYSKEYADLIRPWIADFKALSSREKLGTQILYEITGRKNIPVVLDPTLLLSSEYWRNFELKNRNQEVKIDKSYLLAYFLTPNENYISEARKIANKFNLTLVMFDNLRWNKSKADIILTGGPMEFLTTIANASYVITDSFHGTIFAINFRRPFLTVKRFKDSEVINQNSRIENLFEILGIKDNFFDENSFKSLPGVPDWEELEYILEKERIKSIEYLKKALL